MELPEAVRARLVSLVAASLADVSPLPAALKQVAGFAPARRARLGATAIMSELERDDELRERVAVQVRVRATGDVGDVAVLAWLERSEGWQDAVRRVPERAARAEQRRQQEQREQRLRDRADEADRTLREAAAQPQGGAGRAEGRGVHPAAHARGDPHQGARRPRGGRGGPGSGRGDRGPAGA